MLRIRFHGRGGQGIITASRILGTAFFLAGYEVQDAPRYGAERRGAPLFGYIRADRSTILERGIIVRPSLVVVVDETLLHLPAAEVLSGLVPSSILLVLTDKTESEIKATLKSDWTVLSLKKSIFQHFHHSLPIESCGCSGAAACLVGLPLEIFQEAMTLELKGIDPSLLYEEFRLVEEVYCQMADRELGRLEMDGEKEWLGEDSNWIDLKYEAGCRSRPAVYGGATSMYVKTGAWRIQQPVIHLEDCDGCRQCYTFCPDGVISMNEENEPVIDYEHCKGCLVCVVQCPRNAIVPVAEHDKEANDA